MCILSKVDFAKFGVSNFFSKVIEEKPFEGGGGGVASTPSPLIKEGLKALEHLQQFESPATFATF